MAFGKLLQFRLVDFLFALAEKNIHHTQIKISHDGVLLVQMVHSVLLVS